MKGDPSDIVEHQVGELQGVGGMSTNFLDAGYDVHAYPEVQKVDECPTDFLAHAGDSVDDYLTGEDEDRMDQPSAWVEEVGTQ